MSAMSEDDLNFWQKFQDSLHEKGAAAVSDNMFLETLANAAAAKPLRYEEFYHLLKCYPYLDLHHPDGFDPDNEPRIVQTPGGWDIQDFGDRIRTSPGRFLFGAYFPDLSDQDDADGSRGSGNPIRPQGLLSDQMISMADEMVLLAVEKGWSEAVLGGGFYGMIRAAWVAADIQSYKLSGFEPSEADAVVNVWVRQILTEKQNKMKQRHEALRGIKPNANLD